MISIDSSELQNNVDSFIYEPDSPESEKKLDSLIKDWMLKMFVKHGDNMYKLKPKHFDIPDEPEMLNKLRSTMEMNVLLEDSESRLEKGMKLCKGYNFKDEDDKRLASYIVIAMNFINKFVNDFLNKHLGTINFDTRPIKVFIEKSYSSTPNSVAHKIGFQIYHYCDIIECCENATKDSKWLNVHKELQNLIYIVIDKYHQLIKDYNERNNVNLSDCEEMLYCGGVNSDI